jgi:hypothetical protein
MDGILEEMKEQNKLMTTHITVMGCQQTTSVVWHYARNSWQKNRRTFKDIHRRKL